MFIYLWDMALNRCIFFKSSNEMKDKLDFFFGDRWFFHDGFIEIDGKQTYIVKER